MYFDCLTFHLHNAQIVRYLYNYATHCVAKNILNITMETHNP